MVHLNVELNNGVAEVTIEGSAVIDTAARMYQVFAEALDSQVSVVLDTSKITECDVSFIQMVHSLCSTLCKGGRTLEFRSDSISDPVCRIIKAIGFNYQEQCSCTNNRSCIFTDIVKLSDKKEIPSR